MYGEGEDNVDPLNNPLLDLMSDDDFLLYTQAYNRDDKSTMSWLLKKYNNEERNV
jgi:hypothetical protein